MKRKRILLGDFLQIRPVVVLVVVCSDRDSGRRCSLRPAADASRTRSRSSSPFSPPSPHGLTLPLSLILLSLGLYLPNSFRRKGGTRAPLRRSMPSFPTTPDESALQKGAQGPPLPSRRSLLPGRLPFAGNRRLRQVHRADLVAHLPPRRALSDLTEHYSRFMVSTRGFLPSPPSLSRTASPWAVVAVTVSTRRVQFDTPMAYSAREADISRETKTK